MGGSPSPPLVRNFHFVARRSGGHRRFSYLPMHKREASGQQNGAICQRHFRGSYYIFSQENISGGMGLLCPHRWHVTRGHIMDTTHNRSFDDKNMIAAAEKILAKPLSELEFYVQMFLEGYSDKPRITDLVAEWMQEGKVVMDNRRRIKLNGASRS